ncbi:MAG TPA: GNAT family N-acetyltransferase, partial [Anaerolineae bacterium]|nr:GNAT family N-acetyltransferase [Anaerolineae bacterium]
MDSANWGSQKLGATALKISVAAPRDQAAITQLIKQAEYVHGNADWSISADWWQQQGAFIATRDNKLQAFIAATCDPAPVAWLRTLVIGMSEPAYAMRKLLPPVLVGMREAGARLLACLSPYAWLDAGLAKHGFRVATVIEEMVRDSAEIPPDTKINVLIRQAGSADIAPIIALDKKAFIDPIWWLSASQLGRAAEEAFSFTVAENAGKIVGYQLSLQESPAHAHIVRLSVDPTAQG